MGEITLSSEAPQYQREQVVDALQKLVKRGFAHPDDLPPDDPEVEAANKLFEAWAKQQGDKAKKIGTQRAKFEHNLEKSTLFVDAGFLDPDYLDEVANDWLIQDLDEAESAGLIEVAKKIQVKMDEIERLRQEILASSST